MSNELSAERVQKLSSPRVASLDGLRGCAAMVVLVCHCLLVFAPFSTAYGMGTTSVTGPAWWITYTPLHLVWAGTEAVYVFFILSGFILAGGAVAGRGPVWRSYYPKRLLRLYLPVWAALVFAVATYVAVDHSAESGTSGWLQVHDSTISVANLLRDTSLMVRPGAFITPLWSLKWEVVFSLLLPVFLLLTAARLRRWWPVVCVALVSMVAAGDATGLFALTYLPMFGIGVLLAAADETLRARSAGLSRTSWAALWVGCVGLLTARWTVAPFVGSGFGPAFTALAVCGAAVLLGLFNLHPPTARMASHRAVQWLGLRSFSLYLIHEPIVVTTAMLLPRDRQWLVPFVAVPIALASAACFFRCVEVPSHRLAQRAGLWFVPTPAPPSSPS